MVKRPKPKPKSRLRRRRRHSVQATGLSVGLKQSLAPSLTLISSKVLGAASLTSGRPTATQASLSLGPQKRVLSASPLSSGRPSNTSVDLKIGGSVTNLLGASPLVAGSPNSTPVSLIVGSQKRALKPQSLVAGRPNVDKIPAASFR